MKKINWVILVMLYLMVTNLLNAQNNPTNVQQESDRIALRVAIPKAVSLNNDATLVLYNRLNQAVALNGLGSTSNAAKFLLVPSVTVLSKDVTTQVPQQFVVEMEVLFFIVDNSRKLILQQEAIQVKGIGSNENKAIQNAVNSIQARNPKLKNLIVRGKEKIVAYYEDQCDILMKSIQSYIDRKMYFEAYFELNSVPYLINNVSCYEQSLTMLKQLSEQEKQEAEAKLESEQPDVDWVSDDEAKEE